MSFALCHELAARRLLDSGMVRVKDHPPSRSGDVINNYIINNCILVLTINNLIKDSSSSPTS